MRIIVFIWHSYRRRSVSANTLALLTSDGLGDIRDVSTVHNGRDLVLLDAIAVHCSCIVLVQFVAGYA